MSFHCKATRYNVLRNIFTEKEVSVECQNGPELQDDLQEKTKTQWRLARNHLFSKNSCHKNASSLYTIVYVMHPLVQMRPLWGLMKPMRITVLIKQVYLKGNEQHNLLGMHSRDFFYASRTDFSPQEVDYLTTHGFLERSSNLRGIPSSKSTFTPLDFHSQWDHYNHFVIPGQIWACLQQV